MGEQVAAGNKKIFRSPNRVSGGDRGGIAQLGEHLPCKQGVKGSNPFISIAGEPERASRVKHIKRGLIAQPVRAHA